MDKGTAFINGEKQPLFCLFLKALWPNELKRVDMVFHKTEKTSNKRQELKLGFRARTTCALPAPVLLVLGPCLVYDMCCYMICAQ